MICDKCGAALAIGEWPFCPHGTGQFNAQGDEIDFWAENAFREPRHFTSQKAYEKALDDAGLRLNPHHVPGGKLANWATIDPQTLENARVLVSRRGSGGKEASVTLETMTWTSRTVTDGPWMVRPGDSMRTEDL